MNKIKCKQCGSTNIVFGDIYVNNPLSKKEVKTLKKDLKQGGYLMFECLGDCEDETTAVLEHNGVETIDEEEILEILIQHNKK